MKLFRRAARIVDDAVLLQSGDAGCVKPDAHHERPEDEHDHWRENWVRQCQSPDRRCMGRLYPRLSNGRNGSHAIADRTLASGSSIRTARMPGSSLRVQGEYHRSPNWARKNPSTSALNCLWKATRSKPGASVQISARVGLSFARGGQGLRKAKCPEFGTT